MNRKLEKAATQAQTRMDTALSVFQDSAGALESAAEQHETVALEAARISDEHWARAQAHNKLADEARTRAKQIRELFGVEK